MITTLASAVVFLLFLFFACIYHNVNMLLEVSKLQKENDQLNEERQQWRSRMGLKVESDIVQENTQLWALLDQMLNFNGSIEEFNLLLDKIKDNPIYVKRISNS